MELSREVLEELEKHDTELTDSDEWDCTGVNVGISEARNFVEIGPYSFAKSQAIALAFVILHLADKLEG